MEARVSGKKVVIELDIDTLVTAFDYKEDNQDVYKVKYKKKFAQGVCDYLKNHNSEYESGLTGFQQLLDDIFFEMTCADEDYIKELQTEE
jgi:hypothetical protein